MPYKLISFDFDGTLADSADWFLQAFNQLADEYGYRPILPEDRDRLRGYDTRGILKHVGIPLWKLPPVMARLRKLCGRNAQAITLFPGIEEMLRQLHNREVALAIVSSNSEETIRKILGPELASIFDHYCCGAGLFGKTAKLKTLLRKSRCRPAELIYIGDETRDGLAARQLSIDFGAVAWGYATPEALQALDPKFFFEDPRQILSCCANSSTTELDLNMQR